MAYLPTEPLKCYLHGAIDEELRGQGGYRSGMQGVAFELSRVACITYNASERQLHRILSGEITKINERTADAIASALGMTPIEIWSDWYEITNKRVAGWSVLRLGRRPSDAARQSANLLARGSEQIAAVVAPRLREGKRRVERERGHRGHRLEFVVVRRPLVDEMVGVDVLDLRGDRRE